MKHLILMTLYLFGLNQVLASAPDWSEKAFVPLKGRANPYDFSNAQFLERIRAGQVHAQRYPVEVTGVLLPEEPFKYILDNTTYNPVKILFNKFFQYAAGVKSFEGLFKWLGLSAYPKETDPKKFQIAFPDGERPSYLMGYSQIDVNGTKAFTMSCATCHSDQLFGQSILGMSKRFPKANEFFIRGHETLKAYNKTLFKLYTGATDHEVELLDESVKNLRSVGFRKPLNLGLDTSLAQVALSLNKRNEDAWATKSQHYQKNPRPDFLDSNPGDSKPAVWWNLKYKNRWLSDGSVVSGNPIYTNILWNEVGRGTNLKDLAFWLQENSEVIEDLTSMTFANEAPRIEDFFPAKLIDKDSALRGETLYNTACAKCHGTYIKNWSLEAFKDAPWSEQIKTAEVKYFTDTPVVDVGTDPYRYLSMKSLEKLNDLKISEENNILIKAQKGYVPPPLVGIWARWPYMHNNSMPSLCAVLSPESQRPKSYYAGAPIDKSRDFDFECNGYPLGDKAPRSWKTKDKLYQTGTKGLSNSGHDQKIFVINGKNLLNQQSRKDLIQFLQSL